MSSFALIALVLAGALLGVHVGRLPRWAITVATIAVLVFAIVALRSEVGS